MTHDQGFWTWPVDPAASQSRSRGWALATLLSYGVGATALLLQTIYGLTPRLAGMGVALIIVGVVSSIGVLGRVIVTRRRLVH